MALTAAWGRARAVAGVALAAAAIVLMVRPAAVSAAAGPEGFGPVGSLPGRGVFNGVAAVSGRDLWAVGCAGTCNLNRPASLIARERPGLAPAADPC